jgi:hypothetical protein
VPKKVPPPTPEGHEGRLFPPEQRNYLAGKIVRKQESQGFLGPPKASRIRANLGDVDGAKFFRSRMISIPSMSASLHGCSSTRLSG